MNVLGTRIAFAGALLVLSAVSGVILTSLGKPLSSAVFAVHKLIAVSSLVFAVLVVVALGRRFGMAGPALFPSILTGLLLLSLFVSGALLSLGRPVSSLLLAVHKLAPLMAFVSGALLLWIRLRGRG